MREFNLKVIVTENQSVEVVGLISQIMESYGPHLSQRQCNAVGDWFVNCYVSKSEY